MKAPRSLQGQLVALVLATVLGVWLATAAITWYDANHELDELLDGHLAQAAALLVAQHTRGEVPDDNDGVETPALHRYAPRVAFQVFHEGRLILRSVNAPFTPMVPQGTDFRSGFASVRMDHAAWRVFATYGAERDVQVYVAEQIGSRTAILWAVLRSTLWPMAVALPLLALAAWAAVYRGLKPIRQLEHALAGRQPQALDRLEIHQAPSEIAPMIDALNRLFARIGELLESERRFTADAAHELRTPVAAIRMQAQVAMAEPDDALRRQALQHTLEGCDRASRLIEQLLTLARMEADATAGLEQVDLAALARRVVAEIAPMALARQQALELQAEGRHPVRGNPTLLGVLIRNLVDNAVRYSPAHATVRVGVEPSGRGVALTVEDSGPGLSEEQRQRLGERFFRVLGNGESGSGLGWSIVRRIALLHGLQVRVERSAQLGGLRAVVLFEPAAPGLANRAAGARGDAIACPPRP